MPNQINLDAGMLTSVAIFAVVFVAILFLYPRRAQLAAVSTPYIDALTGKAVLWMIALVILVTIVTALLSVFGLTGQIRIISAENLMYISLAYAAARWGVKQ